MDKHEIYLAASELFVSLHKFMVALQSDMANERSESADRFHETIKESSTVLAREGVREIEVTLLGRNGEVPPTSRLNMGHSQHYNNHQASILIHSASWEFFPEPQFPFDVHTDDQETLRMKVSGASSRILVTTPNYRTLSEYIRGRLGVPIETPITRQILENYGRTSITFRKKDEQYFLDFKSNKTVGATNEVCEQTGFYQTSCEHEITVHFDLGDTFPMCPKTGHIVLWKYRPIGE